jgi:hypothetical protein
MYRDLATRRVVFFGDSRADWRHLPVLPGLQRVAAGVPGASALDLARRFQAVMAPPSRASSPRSWGSSPTQGVSANDGRQDARR